MSGMIMVQSQAEETLLLTLVKEFASKVVFPRISVPTETFKRYAEKGVYGIVGVETDEKTHESLFQIQLPPSFLGYIEYEVHKLRNFVAANEVKNPGKNILL
jgi:hypothetical protein